MNPLKHEKMRVIRDEVLALTTSPLYAFRRSNNYFPVIGEGSHDAHFLFVGEAPGRNEAKTGRPFCGAAGKILEELLLSAGMKREEVYITNIVKDRPPENRDPTPDEIAAYGPFLDRQIEIIGPKVIVTLGRYAMGYIMERMSLLSSLASISSLHGTVHKGVRPDGVAVTVVPLYHPAAAIYNIHLKETLKADFAVLAKER